ncbi:MAG: hypothetical protein OEY34_01305 [Cyclobacteriaceae bacterium]|nr:hypothetical protein [Cyclobacteriaceae bacterium]
MAKIKESTFFNLGDNFIMINKSLYIILVLIGISFSGYGQYEHIQFKNEYERTILSELENHTDIEILLAISENGSKSLENKITSHINALKSELSKKKFEAKSEEKKLKLLFDLTHKTFFLKYKEVSNFNEIFNTKEYNCVSATALYSLILNEYNIPYSIKETPTHVFLIAYPSSKDIILESTAPTNGYFNPSSSEIQKAVNSLIELKYYTQEEVESKGIRQVYNEFFYNEDEIDLKKLAGLQYHNEAIKYYSEDNYEQALNSIYKSRLLYPSEKSEFLSYAFLSKILNKTDFTDFKHIKYLAQFANLPIVDSKEIISAYSMIINNRLFFESDHESMDSIYSYLKKQLSDSTLIKDLSEIHYEGFAKYYAKKSDFNKSLEYSTKAFEINPNNVNTQSLITQSLVQDLYRRGGSESTLEKMNESTEVFPFLKENSLFQSLYFHTYATSAYYHLRADDLSGGLNYLKMMESLIEQFGNELKYDENQYGMIYAEAGATYFRMRKYKEAKKIIEKGLSIIPNHPELKIRLQIVIDEMK